VCRVSSLHRVRNSTDDRESSWSLGFLPGFVCHFLLIAVLMPAVAAAQIRCFPRVDEGTPMGTPSKSAEPVPQRVGLLSQLGDFGLVVPLDSLARTARSLYAGAAARLDGGAADTAGATPP